MLLPIVAGVILTALGIAVRAGLVPQLQHIVYPILWWGLLLLVDQWNRARRGLSLWSIHTFAITAPASVLLWLFFELLNLASPQWRYEVGLRTLTGQVLLGVASFATVIPIVVESWWIFAGSICLPIGFRRHRGLLLGAAALFTALPFVNHVFWLNQPMWLVPGLAVLPWTAAEPCGRWQRWSARLAVAGIVSGLCWEALNYGLRTRWEYLILRDWPHLFEMPVLGYLGFIPFTFSVLMVFEALRRVPARPAISIALYAGAFLAMAVLTRACVDAGLWIVR